ncbi:hypothetical protein AsFPU1_4233 [Aphanothece sacrum FPU1]|uniref:Uncharacterized protein n=1 Tax=Aphanothece sacrum FPU1 TaxID=1920663 RepID=A0A401INH6_APHSA|nr:hypothetical protein AsFPU1_4233 [Aphanothece sacrum FPU1]GBF85792.1 pre-mRNA cleavage complex II protein [Aphanothece sacrum FPU3]
MTPFVSVINLTEAGGGSFAKAPGLEFELLRLVNHQFPPQPAPAITMSNPKIKGQDLRLEVDWLGLDIARLGKAGEVDSL